MDRNIDPRKFIKGPTKTITMLDGNGITDEAVWDHEYAFFKIAAVSTAGIDPGTTVVLVSNDRYVFLNSTQLTIAPTSFLGGFMWLVTPMCGLNNIKLEIDSTNTGDIVFQITPYEEAQTS